MRLTRLTGALLACAAFSLVSAQEKPVKSDNTRANRDGGQTASEQNMNRQDRELTQKIRKSIMDDKTLSTYAHNVKIISQNGTVTLRGPVRSEDEKAAIEAKAQAIAGVTAVHDELSIVPKE